MASPVTMKKMVLKGTSRFERMSSSRSWPVSVPLKWYSHRMTSYVFSFRCERAWTGPCTVLTLPMPISRSTPETVMRETSLSSMISAFMAPKSSSCGAPKVAAAVILGGGLAPGLVVVLTTVMVPPRCLA